MNVQNDVECPRCGRIDLGFELRHFCKVCGWQIRPAGNVKAYAFDVLIAKANHTYATWQAGTEVRHYKATTASRALARARYHGRILALVPLSEEQWKNAYGEGRL